MVPVNENSAEYKILRTVLTPDEKLGFVLIERRLGGAKWLEPAHVFATNERIIIIRKGIFGTHQSIKAINYKTITETKLENGILFSRMHFTLEGENEADSQKWLIGLVYKEALAMVRYVNDIVDKRKPLRENKH